MDSPLPHIMESSDMAYSTKPKDRLVSILDQIELRVEQLRRDASRLEEEKDTMLTTLDTLKNSEEHLEPLDDCKLMTLKKKFVNVRYTLTSVA